MSKEAPLTCFISRPEGRLAYDLHLPGDDAPPGGSDSPLFLCVPGMGDTRAQYRHLWPLLVARGYRVATLDLRGLGESDSSFASYGPEDVGADVAALLVELDERDAVLVGNSFAAAAVTWAAAEQPDRVSGLAFLGPFARDLPMNPLVAWAFAFMLAGPWGRHAWAWWYGQIHAGGVADDHAAHVADLKANLAQPGRMAAFRAMAAAPKAPCAARIPEVQTPTLVVMGGADPDFPDPAAEAAQLAELYGGRAVVLDGLGHYPQVEQPERVAELLADHASRREL